MNDAGSSRHAVVGIDLGTTYSAVAAYNDDEADAEVLPDTAAEGLGLATPSVVWDRPGSPQVVVGADAKDAIPDDPGNVRIEVKREMGAEAPPQKEQAPARDPVRIDFRGKARLPQELSALVLMKMKEIAERGLGRPVHDAVITVPAYFTERQKKATEEAALLAGLYPRQLIPEPTAAAICYGFDRADAGRHVYLVYDLGGGTFDVSIIVVEQESIEVLATSGNPRLGGGNFDDAICDWAIEQLGVTAADDGWRQRLKAAAETAKQDLARYEQTQLEVPARVGAGPSRLTLTRATFESLISDLLRGSLSCVEDALSMAAKKGVAADEVDAVLLVGGSTRIGLVQRMLLEHFRRSPDFVRSDANPDTIVARGAAIVAHRFAPSDDFHLDRRPDARQLNEGQDEDLDITYITEHTLGVGVEGGMVSHLIPRGENIPREATNVYSNPENATDLHCPIYQGESRYAYENELVGTVLLTDIEPRPEGWHHFEVTFSLDINGLLDVRVIHRETGREFRSTFEQSTQVEQTSPLAKVREELRELYRGGDASPDPDEDDPLPDALPDD
jgi:molecular chaperone DnaK (HSP70)